MQDQEKINLFISYAHKDKYEHEGKKSPYFEDLEKFIINADQFTKIIDTWTDAEIILSSDWDEKIKQNLDKADIVVLVISQEFLNSKYIKTELDRAFTNARNDKCAIIPLFFERCDLTDYEFLKKQGYPSENKFINEIDESDRPGAFTEFQIKIKSVANEILEKKRERKKRSAGLIENNASLNIRPLKEAASGSDALQSTKLIESNDNIYAVLIANYKFSKLKDKDIQNVRVNLSELENTFKNNLNFKNIFPIDNKDNSNIRKDLERIINKCPNGSTLLLYYSGHGLIESNSFYCASEDTELDPEDNKLLKSSAVGADYIKDLILGCKAKHKVLIFDCCYSSAFLQNSLSVDDNSYIKQSFAIKDTYYLFSSIENQVSLYPLNQPERPTYFTEAFLKALNTGVEPNYEYCSLQQIFELTKDELEKIKDPSGIPVPKIIKPDNGPLEEIKICTNPKYVRRSEEKELSTDFGNKSNDEIKLWAYSGRMEPGIENALNTLIERHKDEIDMILIDTSGKENIETKMLNQMIQFLKKAIEKKNDIETFKAAFRNYEKKSSELSNSQKQKNDNPANYAAFGDENNIRSEKILPGNENLKAEKENINSFTNNETSIRNEKSNQAQFK